MDPSSWRECIALVLGRISGDHVDVTDIVPIGAGSSIYVDITNYERVFSLIPFNRIDQGEVIVGWAHTHPGLGLFLSGTDIRTQKSYQQMHTLAFALVLDPSKITSAFPGFNIYRLDDLANPYIAEYEFNEEFDYYKTQEDLVSDLYVTPVPPLEPFAVSNAEISWKNINLSLSGKEILTKGQLFFIELSISLPFRQYIRIEYEIESNQNTINPFNTQMIDSKGQIHETIDSGRLCIHSFRAKEAGKSEVKVKHIKMTDYKGTCKEMPNLLLISQID